MPKPSKSKKTVANRIRRDAPLGAAVDAAGLDGCEVGIGICRLGVRDEGNRMTAVAVKQARDGNRSARFIRARDRVARCKGAARACRNAVVKIFERFEEFVGGDRAA